MTDIYLGFQDDDHRDAVLERLRSLGTLPDGELVERDEDDDDRLTLDADDPNAALARATVLMRGALDGTEIDPATVRLSAGGGFV